MNIPLLNFIHKSNLNPKRIRHRCPIAVTFKGAMHRESSAVKQHIANIGYEAGRIPIFPATLENTGCGDITNIFPG